MRKTSCLVLSMMVFITSVPREGLTQVAQSMLYIGSGITPFALEQYVKMPPIEIPGAETAAGKQEDTKVPAPQTPAVPAVAASPDDEKLAALLDQKIEATDISWDAIEFEHQVSVRRKIKKGIETSENPLESFRYDAKTNQFQITIGDFNDNFNRLVLAERMQGAKMEFNVGEHGLTLKSLLSSARDSQGREVDEWNRPSIIADRAEQEIAGAGLPLEAPALDRMTTGVNIGRNMGIDQNFDVKAIGNVVRSVDVTTEWLGFLKNRIEVAHSAGGAVRTNEGNPEWGNALSIQNTAQLKTWLGQTALHLNYERVNTGFEPLGGSPAPIDSQSVLAGVTHKFNKNVSLDASFRYSTENYTQGLPFILRTYNPAISVTVRPFTALGPALANSEFTARYEYQKRLAEDVFIKDDARIASLSYRNQIGKWAFYYNYRHIAEDYPLYSYQRSENRHRVRFEYKLRYRNIDFAPFVSGEFYVPVEAEGGTKEYRAGLDISKELENHYRVLLQTYYGVQLYRPETAGKEFWPVAGMELSLQLLPECTIAGGIKVTGPSSNSSGRPAAIGDMRFSMQF